MSMKLFLIAAFLGCVSAVQYLPAYDLDSYFNTEREIRELRNQERDEYYHDRTYNNAMDGNWLAMQSLANDYRYGYGTGPNYEAADLWDEQSQLARLEQEERIRQDYLNAHAAELAAIDADLAQLGWELAHDSDDEYPQAYTPYYDGYDSYYYADPYETGSYYEYR